MMFMKKFKKIYIEITNSCNLDCDFCIKNSREKKFMSFDSFKLILDKINNYTDYLYLHVLGEPLLHPSINEFIEYANKNFKINITTNGYLVNNIKTDKIRQLNISLHDFSPKYNVDLTDYLDNIFNKIDILQNTYISLRMWVKNEYNDLMIRYINNRYKTSIKPNIDNYKINNHIFINNFHEFIWPNMDNEFYNEEGTCYALVDHIGILADGTIIPCCLDSRGDINLGNIFIDNLDEILNQDRVKNMKQGFKCKKKIEELCKHCNFINKNI